MLFRLAARWVRGVAERGSTEPAEAGPNGDPNGAFTWTNLPLATDGRAGNHGMFAIGAEGARPFPKLKSWSDPG